MYTSIGMQFLVKKMEELYIIVASMRLGSSARKNYGIIAFALHSFLDRTIPELYRSFAS